MLDTTARTFLQRLQDRATEQRAGFLAGLSVLLFIAALGFLEVPHIIGFIARTVLVSMLAMVVLGKILQTARD